MSVEIVREIVYGEGNIGFNHGRGSLTRQPLRFDAYLPARRAGRGRSALVLAFGGAFHRGSKESDAFSDGVGTSTAMADYCRRFAELGVPCFSVEYRLAQTDPEPVAQPVLTRPEAVTITRASVVRNMLGLPPITPLDMARAMEAAFEDVASAFRYIRSHADEYGVDADRIVLGGFSAGGRCAMYAAYAKRVPVAGVVSISGPMEVDDAERYVRGGSNGPPLLLITGESDLDYVRRLAPQLVEHFLDAGVPMIWRHIPGATHFYSAEAKTDRGKTVFATIQETLGSWGFELEG